MEAHPTEILVQMVREAAPEQVVVREETLAGGVDVRWQEKLNYLISLNVF